MRRSWHALLLLILLHDSGYARSALLPVFPLHTKSKQEAEEFRILSATKLRRLLRGGQEAELLASDDIGPQERLNASFVRGALVCGAVARSSKSAEGIQEGTVLHLTDVRTQMQDSATQRFTLEFANNEISIYCLRNSRVQISLSEVEAGLRTVIRR